jgi:protocatechuate 3,4-dioxygenase beta subunit
MITGENLTPIVTKSFEGLAETRTRELVQELVRTLHDFSRRVHLTHDEWRNAIAFLHRVGALSNEHRSEFTLLSDVLGLSSLLDLIGSPGRATPGSVLGPFHTLGSPWSDNPADLVRDNPGEHVLLCGFVRTAGGAALPDATLDFWQNADNGLYWQVDPGQKTDNLRCRLRVGPDGRYSIKTIRPKPYCIPTDGPVWSDLVEPSGRSEWRPAHFHVIIEAPGYRTIVTEIFDKEDPYIHSDAVFGVREALIGEYLPGDNGCPTMRFDFSLVQA